ncbi:MAG: glycosyltransferase family 2 protein [Selenomonadaceae bacterium]|nr:glycosyltransferase family 2 protein [Selenomonadaceae bacterium]
MFNVEKYIGICIDSILAQTFTDFEVIVVDDCSTDRSYEIVSKYTDLRIKLVRQIKNSGESDSRNFGLKIASGEYVYFMDSDDAIVPNTLEIFVNAADESGAGVVYMNSCFQNKIDDPELSFEKDRAFMNENDFSKLICKNPTPRFLSMDIKERIRQEYLPINIFVTPWIKIQRRDLLIKNQIYFPTTSLSADVLFNFAELCLIEKIQVIDACCYFYRKNSASVTNQNPAKKIRMATSSLSEALRFTGQVIQSINCTESIRNDVRNMMEHRMIRAFVQGCFNNALRSKMTREEINSLLMELFCDPRVFDPNLMRVLFNYVAVSQDRE